MNLQLSKSAAQLALAIAARNFNRTVPGTPARAAAARRLAAAEAQAQRAGR